MVVFNKVAPVVIMLVETILIVIILDKRKRQVAPNQMASLAYKNRQHKHMRTTYTLVTMVTVFVLSNVPNIMAHIITLSLPPPKNCEDVWRRFASVTNTVILMNCAFNVLIYYPFAKISQHLSFVMSKLCTRHDKHSEPINSLTTVSEQIPEK